MAESTIGHYEIHERIGQGGMGDVFRGTDIHNGQSVAIKALKPELVEDVADTLERFRREGEALNQLNHPNIVGIMDTLQEDDRHYIIMDYVAGGSLKEVLMEQGRVPIARVLEIGLDLADALTRAHRLNIIHRDLKPANVLLADDGTPRLTDFGVARMGDRSHVTETGMLVGTFAYLSPEACRGEEIDARTDIWSFGVLLYELLTGLNPFKREGVAPTIHAILSDELPDIETHLPECPPPLARLINEMLRKSRDERVRSVRLVGAALEDMIHELETPHRAMLTDAGQAIIQNPNASRFDTPTPNDEVPSPPVPEMVVDGSVVETNWDKTLEKVEEWGRKIAKSAEGLVTVRNNADGSSYVKVGNFIEVVDEGNGDRKVKSSFFGFEENEKKKGNQGSSDASPAGCGCVLFLILSCAACAYITQFVI